MLLSSSPGLAPPSPRKDSPPLSWPLGQQFVSPRRNKLLSLSSTSGQLYLPTEGEHSLLQMAPGMDC